METQTSSNRSISCANGDLLFLAASCLPATCNTANALTQARINATTIMGGSCGQNTTVVLRQLHVKTARWYLCKFIREWTPSWWTTA
eukprot:8112561-Prorocentrum_lima.AAC.2